MKNNKSWKADEMEMAINMKAARCSYVFLDLTLIIWCIAEYIKSGNVPVVPFILECISCVIFFTVKLYLTKKLTKEDSDEKQN